MLLRVFRAGVRRPKAQGMRRGGAPSPIKPARLKACVCEQKACLSRTGRPRSRDAQGAPPSAGEGGPREGSRGPPRGGKVPHRNSLPALRESSSQELSPREVPPRKPRRDSWEELYKGPAAGRSPWHDGLDDSSLERVAVHTCFTNTLGVTGGPANSRTTKLYPRLPAAPCPCSRHRHPKDN